MAETSQSSFPIAEPAKKHQPGWLPQRLERIRQLAEEQRNKGRTQDDCPHDRGTALFVYRSRNGGKSVANGCVKCQKRLGPSLKMTDADVDRPVADDNRFDNPPCVRCGDFGTELHHFAPRAIFGADEAEFWPKAWLCPGCHDYWHRMMKGAA